MEEDNQNNIQDFTPEDSITNTPIEPEQPLTPKPRKKLNKTTIIATLAIIFGLAGIGFGVYGVFFKKTAPTTSENKPESGEETEATGSDFNLSHLIIKDENCLGDYCQDFIHDTGAAYSEFCHVSASVKENGIVEVNVPFSDESIDSQCFPRVESNNKVFTISNFQSQPIDVAIPAISVAPDFDTIFFLMADGTVEYMPIHHAIKNNDVRSYGQVAGVEKVVRLVAGGFQPKGEPIGSGSTILAQREDGKFYDMGLLIMGEDSAYAKYFSHVYEHRS